MNYQYALVRMMEEKNLSIFDVAANTDWTVRYAEAVAENKRWHPCFDSVLKLCYSLRFNVFTFFEFAQVGVRGQSPITNHQSPITNHQSPGTKSFVGSVEEQREIILFLEPLHVALTLRSLRLGCGMTQRQLSRLTAFSVTTISMREGKRYVSFPSMSTIEYYCEAFGISVVAFVYELFLCASATPSHC